MLANTTVVVSIFQAVEAISKLRRDLKSTLESLTERCSALQRLEKEDSRGVEGMEESLAAKKAEKEKADAAFRKCKERGTEVNREKREAEEDRSCEVQPNGDQELETNLP